MVECVITLGFVECEASILDVLGLECGSDRFAVLMDDRAKSFMSLVHITSDNAFI